MLHHGLKMSRIFGYDHHIYFINETNNSQFELFDTCVLKDDPMLIGIISRTYHDFHSHEPIPDCLIISHVPVPTGVLQSFLFSGIPPKGYVFIRFAKQEFGHSLVAERDIYLVSRTFAIGDSVKRHASDAMIGTVVSIYDFYVLEPICSAPQNNYYQQQRPFEFHTGFRNCDETCVSRLPPYIVNPLRHALLYDVPGDELKSADDYEPGGYVVEQDYLGIVQDNDIDAVLLLDNNTVVMVENAWELELVVPDFDRPLVALPEFDELRRPDVIAHNVGGKAFIPTEHLCRGQFVTTSQRNLRNGRWLSGQYDPTCSPQGHVLDVRTRRAHIKWLCPNVYVPTTLSDRAPSAVRPYDNLSSYSDPRELRKTKGLTLLDRGQRPTRSGDGKACEGINTGQDLKPGDQVRFRDPSAAFVKYQGNGHGQYNRVMKDVTSGYDMNEFIVFLSKQRARIRWQDGTVTEDESVLLRPYVIPEQELCPGDIVTMKEGSTQVSVDQPQATATAFNEMIYYQGNYILKPEKVGVIQSVNARERLVRLRWFINPSVKLLQQGNILQKGAYFGPISDAIDDVSLYEIMAHPALMRKRRDIVILPPLKPPTDVVEAISKHTSYVKEDDFGSALISWIRMPSGMDMYNYLRTIARPIAERDLKDGSIDGNEYYHGLDWVGEILDLGLDGLLTVRLCGRPFNNEVRVPWERVLTIIDEEGAVEFPAGAPEVFMEDVMEDDHYPSDESIVSAIEETIEYEGGKRIDNESGDEAWSTDVEEPDNEPPDKMDVDTGGTPITDHPQKQEIGEDLQIHKPNERQESLLTGPLQQPTLPSQSTQPPSATTSTLQAPPTISNLINLANSQTTPPPSFLVLDSEPPPDQFLGPNPTTTPPSSYSPNFLKRLHREHLILSQSLPPSQIYIRTYESRLDLLRTLILGPADTPYESAPFLIDFYLPPQYPSAPPIAHFHSWTSGLGRINPNLYEEGKICLSLLGTWPGRGIKGESDTWSEKANLLQVLMSLMGLVLVKRPFYNEAGFEGYEADGAYKVESLLYSEKAYVMSRGFVKYALLNEVKKMEDVVAWLYLDGPQPQHHQDEDKAQVEGEKAVQQERPQLLTKLIKRAKSLIKYSEICTEQERDELVDGAGNKHSSEAFLRPLSMGAVVMLRRHLEILERTFGVDDEARLGKE